MRVVDVLQQGIADGTHIGAQLYVSRRGAVVADLAVGRARSDVEMRTDSLMTWFSMTKAVTAVAVAQQWERGALDPDDAVMRHLPEFGAAGKERVTIRHLLTHTAGLANADGILQGTPWLESRADNLARIYAATPEYEPGTRAGYHAAAGILTQCRERIVTTGIIGAPAASADDEGPPAQMRVTQQLDRCVERIHIEMCDEAGCHLRLCSNVTVIRYVCRQH